MERNRPLSIILWGFLLLGWMVFLIMILWNALIPSLFKGPSLNYFQTAGLYLLSRIFFGRIEWKAFIKTDKPYKPNSNMSESFREKWASQCGLSHLDDKLKEKIKENEFDRVED